MIKNIIIILILIFSFNSFSYGADKCNYDGGELSAGIESCLDGTKIAPTLGSDLSLEGDGFKSSINSVITKLGGALLLAAIGAIAYGGFMMVISAGEEEQIKKGKDIVKWAMLGALGIVLASSLIAIVVNVIYGIAEK